MEHDSTPMRPVSMLVEVETLPGSERQLPVKDRDTEVHGGQRGPYVGGHIVGSFSGMCEEWIAIRDKSG